MRKAVLKRRTILLLSVFVIVLAFGASIANAQMGGGSRAECLNQANKTLDDLDKWVGEYERQMASAEPTQKGKFEEWIGELKKLKKMVANAKSKLQSQESCSSDTCVSDQCSMIEISEQQIVQLVKESEQKLGAETRFGEQVGRDITKDEETLGDDTMTERYEPDSAFNPDRADESKDSDEQQDGNIGSAFPDSDPDSGLPPSPPKDEASQQ